MLFKYLKRFYLTKLADEYLRAQTHAKAKIASKTDRHAKKICEENLLECILTPSCDLAYIRAAAPINPTCVQLLHQNYTSICRPSFP
jgi:hypothetical protein